ncbi:hypothetical protein ACFO25_15985 [Paenactinomyces guangxiensis]|uniref:Uncharacterized protein n=1 Tax=Paenactinomyces guangxiensis TaxID=1490290 RepID=A0A7W1WUL1_9BACL|nr:hypothetical protein [Paenactinomyces guangxiensis]MBA4496344.1 hypothetical protein [Paenactinomyces guangxiensis]MBH8593628.1 hypothetical protein [Paenactinomyces guangxiensis]
MCRILSIEISLSDMIFEPHFFSFADDPISNIYMHVERTRLELISRWKGVRTKIIGPCYSYNNIDIYPLPRILFGVTQGNIDRNYSLYKIGPGNHAESDLGSKVLPVIANGSIPRFRNHGVVLRGWITKRGLQELSDYQLPDLKEIFFAEDFFPPVMSGRKGQPSFGGLKVLYYVIAKELSVKEILKELKKEKKYKARICNNIKGRFDFGGGEGSLQKGFFISLMTPMLTNNVKDILLNGPAELPFACISASTSKPLKVLFGNQERKVFLIPEGSTWFYQFRDDAKMMDILRKIKRRGVGRQTSYGYGKCLIAPS